MPYMQKGGATVWADPSQVDAMKAGGWEVVEAPQPPADDPLDDVQQAAEAAAEELREAADAMDDLAEAADAADDD